MKKLILLSTFIFLFCQSSLQASHIMGGDLTYTCLGGNTYMMELTIFRDCNGIPLGNQETLSFSSSTCGTMTQTVSLLTGYPEIVTPICAGVVDKCSSPSGTFGVQKYVYQAAITLAGCWTAANDITASWSSCCRNNAITTLTMSGATYFSANLDATQNCNTSPHFLNNPLFFAETNTQTVYSDGGYDPDGDSLVFSLMNCQSAVNTVVSYSSPFSGTNPLSTTNGISLDASTGKMVFTPNATQAGVVCIRIEEYRNGAKIGEVTRDIYIAVITGSGNVYPALSGMNGTATSSGTTGSLNYVGSCATDTVTFTIDAFDANPGQSISWETMNLPSGATFTADTINNTGTFFWVPSPNDFGQIHGFGIKVWDDACPVEGQAMNVYSIDLTNSYSISVTSSATNANIGDTITLNTTMPDPACSVSWTPSAGLSCTTCPNPMVIASASTTYTATVTCSGCTYTGSLAITVNQQVTGTITTSFGAPLANSTVNIYDKNGTLITSPMTDANGNYTVNLNADSVTVEAIPDATAYPLQAGTAYQNGGLIGLGTTNNISFSTDLLPYQLSGTITRADGNPLGSSVVVVIDSTHNIETVLNTDATGFYSYTTYTSHLYLLAIPDIALHTNQIKTYYQSTPLIQGATLIPLQPVTVVDFSTLQFVQMITSTANQTINGVVLQGTETGDPEPDVRLLLVNAANQDIVGEDKTDVDGAFTFENLDTGVYRIWVDQVGIDNALTGDITVSLDSLYQLDSLTCFLHSDYLEVLIPFNTTKTYQVQEISSLNLHPNPATNDVFLDIEIDQPTSISIEIFDLSGRSLGRMINEKAGQGHHEYNLQPLLKDFNGICIVRIQTDTGVVSKRLIYLK